MTTYRGTYRGVVNSSKGPNYLYTLDDILSDIYTFSTSGNVNVDVNSIPDASVYLYGINVDPAQNQINQFMKKGSGTYGSKGTGAVDIFTQNISKLPYAPTIYTTDTYDTGTYGNINIVDLLSNIVTDVLSPLPIQPNSDLTNSGLLKTAATTINNNFSSIINNPSYNSVYISIQNRTLSNYEDPPKRDRPLQNIRYNTNNGITNNITELAATVATQINSIINSYNPTCTPFTPPTIGDQLGSVYATANSSCATAIQLAGQAGDVAGGTNADLLGYDDLVTYWTEVNNQWLTVQNEQIGTSLSENPDYKVMDANLTSINNVCSAASGAYQQYITQEMAAALAPAPFQRPPDTGVTSIINDTIKQYYETEMTYLRGLETQLQGILDYLISLNIPNIDGSANSIIGSKTVLNLNMENVVFSAPTNPPTGIITIEGNPGQQTINMVLSNGMVGEPGAKGPTGNNGANGPPGKEGQMGPPGIFEIPYQYFKSF